MRRAAVLTVAAVVVGLTALPIAPAAAVSVRGSADFDGDGKADIAIAAPDNAPQGGLVYVRYGSGRTQRLGGTQFLAGAVSAGSSLATCDVNGDGYSDLVIGDPLAAPTGSAMSGAVYVVRGSATGLDPTTGTAITQESAGVPGSSRDGDMFGFAIACGRIGGDRYADIAISAERKSVGTLPEAGQVFVVYSSPSGPVTSTTQVWSKNSSGVAGAAKAYANFGSPLAIGDVDADGHGDLVVGAVSQDSERGSLTVIRGGATRLVGTGSSQVTGVGLGLPTRIRWGSAIAIGDFNGDRVSDVAVGGPSVRGGRVVVLWGRKGAGLSAARARTITQESPGVPYSSVGGDDFGSFIASGDIEGDGDADLVIGIPGKTVAGAPRAGAVAVLEGGPGASALATGRGLSQSTAGVPGASEAYDNFGWGIRLTDVTGDTRLDLVVASPLEGLTGQEDGMVHVFKGAATGMTATTLFTLTERTFGDPVRHVSHFGRAVA